MPDFKDIFQAPTLTRADQIYTHQAINRLRYPSEEPTVVQRPKFNPVTIDDFIGTTMKAIEGRDIDLKGIPLLSRDLKASFERLEQGLGNRDDYQSISKKLQEYKNKLEDNRRFGQDFYTLSSMVRGESPSTWTNRMDDYEKAEGLFSQLSRQLESLAPPVMGKAIMDEIVGMDYGGDSKDEKAKIDRFRTLFGQNKQPETIKFGDISELEGRVWNFHDESNKIAHNYAGQSKSKGENADFMNSLTIFTANNTSAGDQMFGLKDEFAKQIQGSTVYKKFALEKQYQAKSLSDLAAHFSNTLQVANAKGDKATAASAEGALNDIQGWFKDNDKYLKTPTFDRATRTGANFVTGLSDAIGSMYNFATGHDVSKKEMLTKYNNDLRSASQPIPIDINSDGRVNQMDVDKWGNPVMSSQFSYLKKDGTTGYNWGSIPEASARVVGQMAPVLIAAAFTDGAAATLLPEAGVATGAMTTLQRGATILKNLNQWKGLRLLDRASTLATVYASTIDQMVIEEMKYTDNVKDAESRGHGRALIEGLTEAIGAPEFGMLRATRYATTARQDIINSLLPGKTFSKGLNSILYNTSSVVGKAFRQSMSESLEEEMALFGNHYLTKAIRANQKDYAREDSLSMESMYATFVDSLASMAPFSVGMVGGQHIIAGKSRAVRNLGDWNVANNPVLYRAKVQELYDKGKLTKEQAATAAARINYLSNKLESIPSFSSIRDLRTLLEDKDEQQRYFNAITNHEELSAIDHTNLKPEQIKELEAEIKKAATTIEKGQKRIEKYTGMSQEEKDATMSRVFQEKKDEISKTNDPSSIVEAVHLAKAQVTRMKDRLNPHDVALREDFIQHAENVLGEWMGTNTESSNKFTQSLYEDLNSNKQSQSQSAKFVDLGEKMMFMAQNRDFIDENDMKDIETGYLTNQVQAITNFNAMSTEDKVNTLADFIKDNNPDYFFEKDALDKTLQVGPLQAEFSQEEFQKARDKALGIRVEEKKEKAKETKEAKPTTLTEEEEEADVPKDNMAGVIKAAEDTEEDRFAAGKRFIQNMDAVKKGIKLSPEAATRSAKSSMYRAFKDLGTEIPSDVFNKALFIMEKYFQGKISKEEFYKEAKELIMKNARTLNGTQIKGLRIFFSFASQLSPHVNIPQSQASKTPVSESKEPAMAVNIDRQQQDFLVKVNAAVDLLSPLKTAAFEVSQNNQEKTDPAIIRNSFFLQEILKNHAGKRVKVQSRYNFLKELSERKGLSIDDFKTKVNEAHEAYVRGEGITELASEINDFFGKDFFETREALGTPELFFIIKTNGKGETSSSGEVIGGLFDNYAPILTVTDVDGKTVDFPYEQDRYPFYANLISPASIARQANENKFSPFVKQLFDEKGEDMQKWINPQAVALNNFRAKVKEDKDFEIVVDIRKVTEGKYLPSGIKKLTEMEVDPDNVIVQSTPDELYNGHRLAGVPGQANLLVNGDPVMMFNNKMDEKEAAALTKVIFNKEERDRFFDDAVSFDRYLGTIVNLFQTQGRRMVFYINKDTDELVPRSVKNGQDGNPVYARMTEEEVFNFLKTSFYNIRKDAIHTMTKRLSLEDGNIVERKQPYVDYIKETHVIHVEDATGKPSTRKNIQLILDPTQFTQAMGTQLGKRPVNRPVMKTDNLTKLEEKPDNVTHTNDESMTKLAKAQVARKAIEANSKKVTKVETVDDNGNKISWYEVEGQVDENQKPIKYDRVTHKVDEENPFEGETTEFSMERARKTGNFIDDLSRAIFGLEQTPAKPDNWSDKAYESVINSISAFAGAMRKSDYFFAAERNYLWDNDARVAGELDCILMDTNGKPIAIIDFKSSSHFKMVDGEVYNYDKPASEKPEYLMQQNSYATMFHKMYGIYPELIIVPIRIKYENKDSMNVTEAELMYNEGKGGLVTLPTSPDLAIKALRPDKKVNVGTLGEVTDTGYEVPEDIKGPGNVFDVEEEPEVKPEEVEVIPAVVSVEEQSKEEVKAVEEPLAEPVEEPTEPLVKKRPGQQKKKRGFASIPVPETESPEQQIKKAVQEHLTAEDTQEIAKEEKVEEAAVPAMVEEGIKEDIKINGVEAKEGASRLSRVIAKIKKKLILGFLAGAIFTGFSFTRNYSMEDIKSFTTRQLVKIGLYTPKENKIQIDTSSVSKATFIDTANLNYEKDITKFEKISQDNQGIWSYRNQWLNKNGFGYVTGENNAHYNEARNTKYYNVQGVAHHLIMLGEAGDLTQKTTDDQLRRTTNEILNSTEEGNYIPVFTRRDGKVFMHYTTVEDAKANINKNQFAPVRLRQTTVDDLDFDKMAKADGFQSNIHAVYQKSKSWGFNSLVYTDKDAYGKFSGGSVVLLFHDAKGNLVVREYSGSVNGIKNEINIVKKEFNVADHDITLGVFDAGSYTGKQVANDETISPAQYHGYNATDKAGSALMIPSTPFSEADFQQGEEMKNNCKFD